MGGHGALTIALKNQNLYKYDYSNPLESALHDKFLL